MKKTLLASLTIALLVLSGCSQKNPEVDMTSDNTMAKQEVKSADTKASDISGVDSNKMDTASVDKNVNKIEDTIAMVEGKIDKIYFDFDKYSIRPDMEPKIQSNAVILNAIEAKNFSVKVEGNSDEWGTDEYNFALALKRAKSVKDSLIIQGVSSDRIMIVSYGESNPACKESNKDCWSQNRRAEFKILP